MPRPYPVESRRRALALVAAGRAISKTALDLEVTEATLYNWVRQDKIDLVSSRAQHRGIQGAAHGQSPHS